jgi:calcineurin-like phosphoesterase family protein
MSDIWFTSDTHFNHKKVQQFCPDTRPQVSLEEHDELMIYNWNQWVQRGDRIYHLGDFSFGSVEYTESVLKRLNGEIHLIYGNHDEVLRTSKFGKYFSSRQDYKEIRIDGQKVVMFHFPIHEWHQCHRGAFHLFGHVHATYGSVRGRSLNVGIDNRPGADMAPWSWQEIKALLETKEIITHH